MSHALLPSILLAVIMAFGCHLATELAGATSGSIVPVLQDSTVHLQVAEYPLGPIEDADGNLWLGSVGSGAMMWDGEAVALFPCGGWSGRRPGNGFDAGFCRPTVAGFGGGKYGWRFSPHDLGW